MQGMTCYQKTSRKDTKLTTPQMDVIGFCKEARQKTTLTIYSVLKLSLSDIVSGFSLDLWLAFLLEVFVVVIVSLTVALLLLLIFPPAVALPIIGYSLKM